MKPKPENPAIAIDTFLSTLTLLSLPATTEGTSPNLKITIHAGAGRDLGFQTIAKGDQIEVFELVNKAQIPFTSCPSLADALTNVIFGAVSYVVAQCNEFAVAKYVKEAAQEHSVFCQNCRELVKVEEFGEKACKKCESEL